MPDPLLQRAAVITAREDEGEEAYARGKEEREREEAGVEAGVEACFGRSVSSSPPPPEGDGVGPLILTRSATLATHVI